jgi:ATP-binding cassette, subfamily B, bacterial
VAGTVSIDGTDIRRFTIWSLRDQISFVLQDTLLFHTPIWQNIAYGRPQATALRLSAAELANAHEFITDMPDGYDTMVGERGVTLSGGQRQRIAIARAVTIPLFSCSTSRHQDWMGSRSRPSSRRSTD